MTVDLSFVDDESPAALAVTVRLQSRFPSLPAAVVADVVVDAFRGLSGPVRGFVPLLAEHEARDVLAAMARTPAAPEPVSRATTQPR
ncbi:hypothetical protein V3N99_06705 [Dermatophilaceae bacterium Soc4.6]